MTDIAESEPRVTPAADAGLLLAASSLLRDYQLPCPSSREILVATAATRTRAYELRNNILELLPELVRSVGRPSSQPEPEPIEETASISRQLLRFLMEHPGCVHGGSSRRRYSDGLRKFVIELHERHPNLDLAGFAEAIEIPVGTVEDWLRPGRSSSPPQSSGTTAVEPDELKPIHSSIAAVIAAYRAWQGNFTSFCDHVRHHLRIDFGNTFISNILSEQGERQPARRRGRSPDEEALRDSFQTFFPGAQWVGDGTPITVTVGDLTVSLNFELMVDAHSGAFTGISIRDHEDSQAVCEAFEHGVETTGQSPTALLLDNLPANHTEQVDQAIDGIIRIRATRGRPQNKAHVEGAFGLFQSQIPKLYIPHTNTPELAKQLLRLIVETWARASNHRPRKDRHGKSRVQIYNESSPTQDDIDEARNALEERRRKQELARLSIEARLDPIVRQLLDNAFERLLLSDPERHFRNALALFSLDTVADAIAIFEGKRCAETLPDRADARYLLGIARNLKHVHEADNIVEALLRERLAARDAIFVSLKVEHDNILNQLHQPGQALKSIVERAVDTDRNIDLLFWIHAAAELIQQQPALRHQELFRSAARRIHATFSLPRRERSRIALLLARAIFPTN